MENINISLPTACYTVEKILGISLGQGNHKNYKVQWAPSWVSEINLMGCEALIKQFLSPEKNDVIDDSQDTLSEEIKEEEDESPIDQNKVESASHEIDIFSGQVQEDSSKIRGVSPNKDVLYDEVSEDKDKDGCSIDPNKSRPVEKDMLCDVIKIEEEDNATHLNEKEPTTIQENIDVLTNTADDNMEDDNETTAKKDNNETTAKEDDNEAIAKSCNTNENNDKNSNDNYDNNNFNLSEENYHFDRYLKDVSGNSNLPINSIDKHDWINARHDSRKQHLNCEDVSAYLSYPGNGLDKHRKIAITKQCLNRKRVIPQDMKRISSYAKYPQKTNKGNSPDQNVNQNCTKTNNEKDFSTYPKYMRNSSQTIVKDNIIQNQNCNVVTQDISTFPKHPSNILGRSVNNNGSMQHLKHNFIDTNNDSNTSSYTKYPGNSLGKSDKDQANEHHGNNDWIDTNGYKNTSTYASHPCNSLENTTSNGTVQDSDHVNSNEGDLNRNSNLIDNGSVLANRFESTVVVNQHTEKSSDAASLQFKSTTSSCENWNALLNDSSSSTSHFHIDDGTQGMVSMDTKFNKELGSVNCNIFNGSLTLQEYIQTSVRESTEPTFSDMVTSVSENCERPTFCNMKKVVKECVKTVYLCKICNITFSLKKLYAKHIKLHVDKKTFSCSVCLKKFNCKNHWQRHERVHTDERPYACEVCGRKFKDYSNLKIHIRRTHTMERPHKCNMCTKMFSTTSDLKKHIRIHTGERPYGCTVCCKRFKTSSQLAGHARRCTSRI